MARAVIEFFPASAGAFPARIAFVKRRSPGSGCLGFCPNNERCRNQTKQSKDGEAKQITRSMSSKNIHQECSTPKQQKDQPDDASQPPRAFIGWGRRRR